MGGQTHTGAMQRVSLQSLRSCTTWMDTHDKQAAFYSAIIAIAGRRQGLREEGPGQEGSTEVLRRERAAGKVSSERLASPRLRRLTCDHSLAVVMIIVGHGRDRWSGQGRSGQDRTGRGGRGPHAIGGSADGGVESSRLSDPLTAAPPSFPSRPHTSFLTSSSSSGTPWTAFRSSRKPTLQLPCLSHHDRPRPLEACETPKRPPSPPSESSSANSKPSSSELGAWTSFASGSLS